MNTRATTAPLIDLNKAGHAASLATILCMIALL